MLNKEKSRFLSGRNLIFLILVGMIGAINAQGITNTLGGNTASDKFVIENKNSEAGLVVTGEGNVGIGNVTPSVELHVKGDKEIFRMESTSLGWLSIFNSSGYQGYLGTWNGADDIDVGTGSGNTTGKLHLVTQATPRMTIIANGNVGIGTTNPNVKLHVFADGSDEDAIYGESVEGSGVKGLHTHPSQTAPAVFGWNTGSGAGVYGLSTYDMGVVGVAVDRVLMIFMHLVQVLIMAPLPQFAGRII